MYIYCMYTVVYVYCIYQCPLPLNVQQLLCFEDQVSADLQEQTSSACFCLYFLSPESGSGSAPTVEIRRCCFTMCR